MHHLSRLYTLRFRAKQFYIIAVVVDIAMLKLVVLYIIYANLVDCVRAIVYVYFATSAQCRCLKTVLIIFILSVITLFPDVIDSIVANVRHH